MRSTVTSACGQEATTFGSLANFPWSGSVRARVIHIDQNTTGLDCVCNSPFRLYQRGKIPPPFALLPFITGGNPPLVCAPPFIKGGKGGILVQ
jgi:hypothetical protein